MNFFFKHSSGRSQSSSGGRFESAFSSKHPVGCSSQRGIHLNHMTISLIHHDPSVFTCDPKLLPQRNMSFHVMSTICDSPPTMPSIKPIARCEAFLGSNRPVVGQISNPSKRHQGLNHHQPRQNQLNAQEASGHAVGRLRSSQGHRVFTHTQPLRTHQGEKALKPEEFDINISGFKTLGTRSSTGICLYQNCWFNSFLASLAEPGLEGIKHSGLILP